MKLIETELEDDHNLFSFGDVHTGSVFSSMAAWNTLVDMLRSEYMGCSNNYGADGGDMIEAIAVNDPRFSLEKLSEPLPLEQMDMAVKMRQPIKHQLLYVLGGNHEYKLWQFGDLAEKIAATLGVPYGTYTTKLTVKGRDGKLMYKLYDTHGRKSITSTADDPKRRDVNRQLITKRHLKAMAGDCAVQIKHHAHQLIVCEPSPELFLTDNGKKIQANYTHWGQREKYIHPDARWYGCAGSMMKLYIPGISGYAEMAEFPPTEMGFLVLRVRNRQIVSLDPCRLKI